MTRSPLAALLLLSLLVPTARAVPVEETARRPEFRLYEPNAAAPRGAVAGLGAASDYDTTWFGGTRWDPVDGRWEALQDSVWTFDTGVGSHYDFSDPEVDPFKDTSLHARMEGWVGIDRTYGADRGALRRLSESEAWEDGVPCVGSAAGLGGSWSLWAGLLPSEADARCYAAGQGYGDSWTLSLERTVAVEGSPLTLSFDYTVDLEPGFDFLYVVVDTGGTRRIYPDLALTGFQSGTASLTLTPGQEFPAGRDSVLLRFQVVTDGAYSDEDGLYASGCGAVAIDGVRLAGATNDSTGFETDLGGWEIVPPLPGEGEDWSNLVALQDLPPMLYPCACGIRDSVLVFEDLEIGGHGLFQDNIAISPWVDLSGSGLAATPGRVLRADVYAELPLLNYLFTQFLMQYYPQVCPVTGALIQSPLLSDKFVYYFGGVPTCLRARIDFTPVIPPNVERIRVAVGVLSYCRFFGGCTGISNSTPWFDNVALGLFGPQGAPFLTTKDLPQDSWPTDGTLRLTSPGRADAARLARYSQDSLGDTLVVLGGLGGAEVRVQFAVDPGPGIDTGRLATWLTSHLHEGSWLGLDWYSARLDTTEVTTNSSGITTIRWMTAYHEDDPNFTGDDGDLDPLDLDADGNMTHLANDIFPDDLFTPGTRLLLFYKARYDGSDLPATGQWFVYPDTTAGQHQELEILPSSAEADSTWNCVLYVEHAEAPGDRRILEAGLAAALPGASGNFEQVAWDRFDARTFDGGRPSVGRPLGARYGATLTQMFGYDVILWDAGTRREDVLVNHDAAILVPWLTLQGPGLGFNSLYLSGAGIAGGITYQANEFPTAFELLETYVGATWTCDTVREAACPGIPAIRDTAACIQVDPVGGFFTGNDGPGATVLQGNGCPQQRSFDVLGVSAIAAGSPQGNEVYTSTTKGTVEFHSVANLAENGPDYHAVIDGASVAFRRDAWDCTGTGAVADRLQSVLGWFGYLGSGPDCFDPSGGGGPCGTNFPDATLSSVPSALVGTPNQMFDNVITVMGCAGPVAGAVVEIAFYSYADENQIAWGPYQDHPVVTAISGPDGTVHVPLMAGGCVIYRYGAACTVTADGVLIGQPDFISPDIVNSQGYLPTQYQYSPDCGIVVDSADSLFFFALPDEEHRPCLDFNGDGIGGNLPDIVIFSNYLGSNTCSTTSAEALPAGNALLPASPNLVRGSTRIGFSLAEPGPVQVAVYDVTGRLVRTLLDRPLPAGWAETTWDGRDETGRSAGAGLYFLRYTAPRFQRTAKVVLLP